MMHPDLEVVEVRHDESFKVWSHGYPYRTVRWHFHPELELHLIVATTGKYFVGDHIGTFAPGNLVLLGPNLPHNWVSDVAEGEVIEQRNLVVQFEQDFVANCMKAFPEFRQTETLLNDAARGVVFDSETSAAVRPWFDQLLHARGLPRITLFLSVLERLCQARERTLLASQAYRTEPSSLAMTRISHVLTYISHNLSTELREAELAQLAGQSVSAFSRSFRRYTGLPFVQHVNRMRIDLACQLLSSDELSITEICFKSGFNNLSNFNRQFRAAKGMSPSEFRNWQQVNAESHALTTRAPLSVPYAAHAVVRSRSSLRLSSTAAQGS